MPRDLCVLVNSENLYREVLANFSISKNAIKNLPIIELVPNLFVSMVDSKIDDDMDCAILASHYNFLVQQMLSNIRKVWFNPNREMSPAFVPVHDGEINHLGELTNLPDLMNKPSLKQCLEWWNEWSVPENVRRHSRVVSWMAYVLAVMLRNQGIEIDPILTHRGGMLHDIDKIKTLHLSGQHGQHGADFLEEKGFPLIATILREHLMHTILEPDADERSWEIKLVYFCDKLVEGDQIVTFNKRLDALMNRYPDYVDVMRKAEEPIWRLNDQICEILSVPGHEALIKMLKGMLKFYT